MTGTAPTFNALAGLAPDLQRALLAQVRDLWTHGSTASEGNTLTLGETKFVIEEGLTVSGKPLKDQQELVGHARAIELMYGWLQTKQGVEPVTEAQVFSLHQAVQTAVVSDIMKPNGAYKKEPNGIYAVAADGRQTFIDYATPADTPALMAEWLAELNRLCVSALDVDPALTAYARLHLGLVRIHPFWDGNGRMARLLANLPMLRAGHLPVVIPVSERKRYIDMLAGYQLAIGQLGVGQTSQGCGVWPRPDLEGEFERFCRDAYTATQALVAAERERQARRSQH